MTVRTLLADGLKILIAGGLISGVVSVAMCEHQDGRDRETTETKLIEEVAKIAGVEKMYEHARLDTGRSHKLMAPAGDHLERMKAVDAFFLTDTLHERVWRGYRKELPVDPTDLTGNDLRNQEITVAALKVAQIVGHPDARELHSSLDVPLNPRGVAGNFPATRRACAGRVTELGHDGAICLTAGNVFRYSALLWGLGLLLALVGLVATAAVLWRLLRRRARVEQPPSSR